MKMDRDTAGLEETDLWRIQRLFPLDKLMLSRKECQSPKAKGALNKQRSITTAKLHRVLSGKSKVSPTDRAYKSKIKGNSLPLRDDCRTSRQFVMEGPTQFTVGVQSQERILFLFTDQLLIAKVRSSGLYKLKETVRVSELWLGSCIEDVCEVTLSSETSFVIGWPTNNVVATFSSSKIKNMWFSKLKRLTMEARSKETKRTTVPITYNIRNGHDDQCKYISVSSEDTALDCILLALLQLGVNKEDLRDYKLWVKSAGEASPYPLIGHESPYAIKMNSLRRIPDTSGKLQQKDVCTFILRNTKKTPPAGMLFGVSRKSKVSRKTLLMNKVFRRSASKPDFLDCAPTTLPHGKLFGHHLSRLCENKTLPAPVLEVLRQLLHKGPFTHGIFRKSANTKLVRELREKLDLQTECKLENVNILILAAVFKEFLRTLPNCLLLCELYEDWLGVSRVGSVSEKVTKSSRLLGKLPKSHTLMLQHFLCVLWHIAQRSAENQMTASNLAVCVGPSLLWSNNPQIRPETSKQIPPLIEFLIEKVTVLFGKEVLTIFGGSTQKDISRQDSGAEESDSMHSSGGLRRDDSSIDSLEHVLLGDSSPKLPRRSKMSLTNLSRDSGLTLSDSQLYTADEDEGDSQGSRTTTSREGRREMQQSVFSIEPPCALNSKVPVYELTLSSCELPKSSNIYLLMRSKSTLHSADYERKPSATETCSPLQRVAEMSENNQKEYPYYRREPHKRRLSRPRRWFNPKTEWDPDDISPCTTLRRSASEESLLINYAHNRKTGEACEHTPGMPASKHKSGHHRRTCNQPLPRNPPSPGMFRSKSVYQLVQPDSASGTSDEMHNCCSLMGNVKWHRTQSTPHLDDPSYDSSTLSDDDSTPHVSRSNSRGKEYVPGASPSRHTSHHSLGNLHGNLSSPSNENSADSGFASLHSIVYPPSYEETMNRQTFLRQNTPGVWEEPLYVNINENVKNTVEKSFLLCNKEMKAFDGEIHYASPVKVESSDESKPPPPLPPKPRPTRIIESPNAVLHWPRLKTNLVGSASSPFKDRSKSSSPGKISQSPAQPGSPTNTKNQVYDFARTKKSHNQLRRSPIYFPSPGSSHCISPKMHNSPEPKSVLDRSSDSSSTASSSSSNSSHSTSKVVQRQVYVNQRGVSCGPHDHPTKRLGYFYEKASNVTVMSTRESKVSREALSIPVPTGSVLVQGREGRSSCSTRDVKRVSSTANYVEESYV